LNRPRRRHAKAPRPDLSDSHTTKLMNSSDALACSRQRVTGVVFDLDGTLVDSAPDIAESLNQVLATHGIAPQSVEFVEQFIGEGSYGLVANLYAALGVEATPARVTADVDAYLALYRATPVRHSTLFDGAAEAIPALHAAGLRLGVCTNKAQHLAEAVLTHFGLRDYFAAIVGGDTLDERKPAPRHLLETLSRMNVEPGEAVFVGDTPIDAECGRRAEVRCLIVNWGGGSKVPVPASERLGSFGELHFLCENSVVDTNRENHEK
jgi:phosphoglycolate phosphatase